MTYLHVGNVFILEPNQREWGLSGGIITKTKLSFFVLSPHPDHAVLVHGSYMRLADRARSDTHWDAAHPERGRILAEFSVAPDV